MTKPKSGATTDSDTNVHGKSLETEKPARSEEQVNLDEEEEDEFEETMEEEVSRV
ncbi:unnamed protein product [Rhodiola kirilowii]